MSQYRRVLLGTILIASLLSLAVPFLRQEDASAFIGWLIIALALADLASTGYIASLVIRDKREPRSWLLLLLLSTSALVTIAFLTIGYLVARRFLGLPPLDAGTGLLFTGMALVLLGAVPVIKAVTFAMVRRAQPDAEDEMVSG